MLTILNQEREREKEREIKIKESNISYKVFNFQELISSSFYVRTK